MPPLNDMAIRLDSHRVAKVGGKNGKELLIIGVVESRLFTTDSIDRQRGAQWQLS
jgi:hypothetical protein